ncbi:MAG: type II secretion system protein GspN [Desulfobacterales bacterium]|nr:type II secretion system protein GspN [Desulfobacterales bacterium]
MKPSKRTLLYTAYIIGITLFFLWYLFPSEMLKNYLANRLSRGNPDVVVRIDRISPVLPPGINLHDVDISHQEMALIEFQSLKVMPGLSSLLGDVTKINFKGHLYDGKLSGRAEIDSAADGSGLKVDGRVDGIEVQQISILQELSEHDISGGLRGNFEFSTGKTSPLLSGNLSVDNCRLELLAAVFNQSTFEFKNVDAKLALQNQTLVVNGFNATGNQLDIKVAGRISFKSSDPSKNRLNLTGTVTPHHKFLANMEKEFPVDFLRNKKSGKTAIPFKIAGSLDDPEFSLN